MHRFFVSACMLVLMQGPIALAQEADFVEEVRELRLVGAIPEAMALAESQLVSNVVNTHSAIMLRLELARLHDRVGLHNNSRPVEAVLEQIEAASALAEGDSVAMPQIELARAQYYYRAEMRERQFTVAIRYAERARALFQSIRDRHGEADAVHLLGLIYLQRRELDQAQTLFDRSLELDQAAGERPFFLGEYGRHAGFVELFRGNLEAALPHLERSLMYRRQVGAVDASMFAAHTLASTLFRLGRVEEAKPHLMYAMMIAEKLGSLRVKTMNGLLLGRIYAEQKDYEAAHIAFEMTKTLAASISDDSTVDDAEEEIEKLLIQQGQ